MVFLLGCRVSIYFCSNCRLGVLLLYIYFSSFPFVFVFFRARFPVSDSPHREREEGKKEEEGETRICASYCRLCRSTAKRWKEKKTKQTRQHTTAVSRKSAGVPFHHKMEGGRRRKNMDDFNSAPSFSYSFFFPSTFELLFGIFRGNYYLVNLYFTVRMGWEK